MRAMKDSGIAWIGEIPKDWEIARIKQLFLEVNDRCESSENYTLLSVSEYYGIAPKSEKISDDDMLTHAETLDGYKICKENDLVMNIMLAWKRALGVSKYVGIVSPAYCIFRKKRNMYVKYFHYLFRTDIYANLFKQYSTGIIDSRLRLYPDKFLSLKCQVPPLDMQHRIADYLDRKCSQIDAIIARQQEVIEKLKAYKLSVITEAVTKGLNPHAPMKDSGVEWIGEIPEQWEIRRIGSFAKVTSSKRIFEESYVDEGVPFYRSKEITDLSKGLNVQTEIFIPEEIFAQVSKVSPAPKSGDILLTSIGTIGNTWISDGRKFYYKDGNITQIEANDSFDSAYLEYCFSSNVVLEQYTRLAMGSILLALTIVKIKKILVVFPPLNEQRKIVRFLRIKCGSIENIVKHKQSLINKLAAYKKSLIYEVVTGKKEVK